jgi:hypothetical protein
MKTTPLPSVAGSYPVAFDLSHSQHPEIDVYFNVEKYMLGVPLSVSGNTASNSNLTYSTDVVFFWSTGK